MLFFRRITLVLALISGPVVIAGIINQGMTYLNWLIPVACILWLLLLGLWYLALGRGSLLHRARRFFVAIGSVVLMGLLGALLLRYEGSSSGSSFPRFSWRWSKPDTGPGAIDAAAPSGPGIRGDVTELAADLVDFLGPDRDGVWETASFGTDWESQPPELLWRRPIGKAWSSFSVSGGRIVTQEQRGDDERVTCLDLVTGNELWSHSDAGIRLLLEREENAGAAMGGDGPRATPTIHGCKVYTMGGTGIVNCLSLESGELLWSRPLIKELGGGIQRWGMASSPLVLPEENAVVFVGSDQPGTTLVACDLATGKDLWRYEGTGASYSSPRVLSFDGVRQIVSVNAQDICAVDPATGERLWRHSWSGPFPKVGQPLVWQDDKILVTASYGAGSLLLQISSSNGKFEVTRLWKSTAMKTKLSSAAILGDHAYGLDEGRLACIDLETGERVWKNQKFGFGQHLLFGNHLLVQAESGEVVIGTISPTAFEKEGRIAALSGMTWNVPVVAGRILLVRNDKEAACYLLPPAQ